MRKSTCRRRTSSGRHAKFQLSRTAGGAVAARDHPELLLVPLGPDRPERPEWPLRPLGLLMVGGVHGGMTK